MKLRINEKFINIVDIIYPNKIQINKYQKLFINENIEEKCNLFLNDIRQEFKNIILKGDKPINKTHFIQFIYPDKDIEMQCYNDIFKILLATINSNCIFDIMIYTTENSFFIHIEDGAYEINEFNSDLFFTEEKFDEFITLTNNTRNKYKNINSIFVFSGHGNSWFLSKGIDIISFDIINKIFDKHKIKFDLICFDACYTSSIEIIYQFYNHSNYIIAHQSYEYAQDINSKYIPIIFDNNLDFYKKLQIAAIEYLERSSSDGAHCSISIINCEKFEIFIKQFKEHLPNIQKIMNSNKSLEYVADLCKDNYQNCSNIVDLYNILIIYNNKELIDLFKQFVFYKNNNIQFDKRVYNDHDNFGGVNIVTNYNKFISEQNNSYDKISFYKYRISK